jgi:MFS superfamily sulfate permease-like transporter
VTHPSAARLSGRARWLLVRSHALLPSRRDWLIARPRDLSSGAMVGLVALPLALGFGVSSGLGARAGLITAIVAGLIAAVFGGSRVQVSGPTGAMTVVLVPIAAEFGRDGVLTVGLLAGAILVCLGYARVGRYIHYVPVPVVEGFTLGIAAIIALQQVPTALGVQVHADKAIVLGFDAVRAWVDDPTVSTPMLTLLSTGFILIVARLRPVVPGSLLVVVAATAANKFFDLGTATIGHLPAGLPAPSFPTSTWDQLDALLLPAVVVAALAALESLLSATVADAMSVGDRHDPDRELFGQGLANLVVPLFGGIPATAAIARTAVNVRAGAGSRLAAVVHAILLLVVVFVASTWVGQIPLAALAGVLIATSIQMVRVSSVVALVHATRGDAVVLAATTAATILLDLVTAVLIGLVIAGFFAVRQTANTARLHEVPLEDGALVEHADHGAEERRLLDEHIVAYRIDGPLFFAAAHDFLLRLADIGDVRVVILRMSRVTTLDATGASVLADTIKRLEGRGITVLLSGVRPEHVQVLRRLGAYERLAHERHAFETTPEAIEHARLHAARTLHPPQP